MRNLSIIISESYMFYIPLPFLNLCFFQLLSKGNHLSGKKLRLSNTTKNTILSDFSGKQIFRYKIFRYSLKIFRYKVYFFKKKKKTLKCYTCHVSWERKRNPKMEIKKIQERIKSSNENRKRILVITIRIITSINPFLEHHVDT